LTEQLPQMLQQLLLAAATTCRGYYLAAAITCSSGYRDSGYFYLLLAATVTRTNLFLQQLLLCDSCYLQQLSLSIMLLSTIIGLHIIFSCHLLSISVREWHCIYDIQFLLSIFLFIHTCSYLDLF
jgi:hypothetical protein